jgi:hypothetical protein
LLFGIYVFCSLDVTSIKLIWITAQNKSTRITHLALTHYFDSSRQDSCMHLTAAHSTATGNPFMYTGKSNENFTDLSVANLVPTGLM